MEETESLDGLAVEAKDVLTDENTVATWLEEIGIRGKRVGTGNKRIFSPHDFHEWFWREYYGGVDFYLAEENLAGSGNTFDNGDITYCEAHHNMAVFYAQTDNPVLSVDVIPIGRVTSDLSVFENLESRVEITFSLAE